MFVCLTQYGRTKDPADPLKVWLRVSHISSFVELDELEDRNNVTHPRRVRVSMIGGEQVLVRESIDKVMGTISEGLDTTFNAPPVKTPYSYEAEVDRLEREFADKYSNPGRWVPPDAQLISPQEGKEDLSEPIIREGI